MRQIIKKKIKGEVVKQLLNKTSIKAGDNRIVAKKPSQDKVNFKSGSDRVATKTPQLKGGTVKGSPDRTITKTPLVQKPAAKALVSKKPVADKPTPKTVVVKNEMVKIPFHNKVISKKSGSNTITPISLKKANNLVSQFVYKPTKGAKRGK